jgi:hypothetical protein
LLRTLIEDFERREHLRRGYDIVMGPQILPAGRSRSLSQSTRARRAA